MKLERSNRKAGFEPPAWVNNATLYEVNLRQYTPAGDIPAFERELPRLKNMGIDILWFMPLTPISLENRKGSLGSYYAASDYLSLNPEFGTLEDFRALVGKAHSLGMKVIIDWVANHTGCDHTWTRSNPDYFLKNESGAFYDSHGWDDVIDLDYANPRMREAMISAMEFWVRECDIDGFRCDMAMLVPVDFWVQARTALDGLKDLFWLAECEDPDYHAAFDATYTWEWMHLTQAYWKGQAGLSSLKELLVKQYSLFPANSLRLYFTSNHDENSWNGTEFEKYGEMAKALAVFSCTWNGMPLLYSGQELPNLKRLKFFDRDPIEWTGVPAMEKFYSRLFHLHREYSALKAGSLHNETCFIRTNAENEVLAYCRREGGQEVLVFLNMSPLDGLCFTVEESWLASRYQDSLSGEIHDFSGDHTICLGAWGFKVLAR